MKTIHRSSRTRGGFTMRAIALAAAILISAGFAGLAQPAKAAAYVSTQLADVKPEDKATVANPQPVQIIFEFRTKGAANPKATQYAKARVLEAVRATGIFSEVSEQPVASGAVLNVVIDNVLDEQAMKEAATKGAVTGATLFIAGSNIAEQYSATIDYVSGPNAQPITRSARHAMIVQMGLINKAPENAVKVGKMEDAFFMMARQIVTNPLNEIAKDPAFAGGLTAPVDAAPVEAAPVEAAPMEPTPASEAPAETAPAEPAAEPATTPQD